MMMMMISLESIKHAIYASLLLVLPIFSTLIFSGIFFQHRKNCAELFVTKLPDNVSDH
jgi:hypothetical protein